MDKQNLRTRRKAMVEQQLRKRGISSPLVLEAMGNVAREAFVPAELQDLAYSDSALPIAGGQTISQPMIVAMMVDALELKGGERVRDIVTGSANVAAVHATIFQQVI